MKLYRTPTGYWFGTKDEAAAFAKTHNTTFEQCDVPYDKAGLLGFLNFYQVGLERAEPVTPEPIVSSEPTLRDKQMQILEVEEFIFNAPLDVVGLIGEVVMSRFREFARKS